MDVDSLVGTVFSGLSALVVQDVADSGGMVVITARTRDVAVPSPVCGTTTAKVHGYHRRTAKDVPVDGRQAVVQLRVRRLVCPALGCRRQTFREQVPGLLERHQRRTVWLVRQTARPLPRHLRARRAADPAVPVTHLLADIRGMGYTGSANLLVRYLNQGRAEGDRPVTTSRHTSRLLLINPDNPRAKDTALLEQITMACPEMAALADLVRGFAALLTPAAGNDAKLTDWIGLRNAYITVTAPARINHVTFAP